LRINASESVNLGSLGVGIFQPLIADGPTAQLSKPEPLGEGALNEAGLSIQLY
jgi:hypothetical protein